MSTPIEFPRALPLEPTFRLMHVGGPHVAVGCACGQAVLFLEGFESVIQCPACHQTVGLKAVTFQRQGENGTLEVRVGYVGRIELASSIVPIRQ